MPPSNSLLDASWSTASISRTHNGWNSLATRCAELRPRSWIPFSQRDKLAGSMILAIMGGRDSSARIAWSRRWQGSSSAGSCPLATLSSGYIRTVIFGETCLCGPVDCTRTQDHGGVVVSAVLCLCWFAQCDNALVFRAADADLIF